jgi:hypothetical protein
VNLSDALASLSNGVNPLGKEPTCIDDQLQRMVVVVGNCWMMGMEPIASECDRLADLLKNKNDPALKDMRWDERTAVVTLVHQLKKVRDNARAQAEAAKAASTT